VLSGFENKLHLYEIKIKESAEEKTDQKVDLIIKQRRLNEAREKISSLEESLFEEFENFKDIEKKFAELQELYDEKRKEASYFNGLYQHAKEIYSKIYQSGYKPDLFDKCAEQSADCHEILHCYVCPKKKKYKKKKVRKKMKIKKRVIAKPDVRISPVKSSSTHISTNGR
jgi:hypothetical protein